MSIEAKVKLWNKCYRTWGREVDLDLLSKSGYEDSVVEYLLDICDNDPALALEVLGHADCDGGWMVGDASGILEKMKNDQDKAITFPTEAEAEAQAQAQLVTDVKEAVGEAMKKVHENKEMKTEQEILAEVLKHFLEVRAKSAKAGVA